MSKKIRYFLIAAGIVFFIIAAPLMLMFVSGLKYDLQARRFVATGILALKTDPKDIKVFLDEKLANDSVQETREIRFLKPESYQLTLKKDGFFDWTKTLKIEKNKVTWANEQNDKIYLLLKNQTARELSGDIKNFTAWPGGLLAISDKQLVVSLNWDLAAAQTFPLPKPISEILPSPDYRFFLLTRENTSQMPAQILLFDRQGQKFSDLTALFGKEPKLPEFKFSQNGRLFALADGSLYEIDAQNSTRRLISAQVSAFALQDQTIYLAVSEAGANKLIGLDLNGGQSQTLLSDLPSFKRAGLFANPQKNVLLVGDNALYAASTGGLVLLSENLTGWTFEQQDGTLTFLTSGELKFVNNDDGKTSLVTRFSDKLLFPKIKKAFGYAFFVMNNKLYALDLDQQGKQNIYQLYAGGDIQKYELEKNLRSVLILDNGVLKQIKLR